MSESITAFLLRCIAEDEAMARATGGISLQGPLVPIRIMVRAHDEPGSHDGPIVGLQIDPAHVLAVCAAHRAIAEWHRSSTDHPDGYLPYCVGCWEEGGLDAAPNYPCRTIRHLATAYADRDGYDPEWRP